ncbi:hypothetical protein HZA97_06355 [Candidatus Woesearchaeota archaeon]|nr:hypothetical protein [Candidatus Woesearchaeota archaeon]
MKAKVFVKINEYEELSTHLENIVGQLRKAKNLLEEIETVKNQEDHILKEWSDELRLVEEGVQKIDETLTELENEE